MKSNNNVIFLGSDKNKYNDYIIENVCKNNCSNIVVTFGTDLRNRADFDYVVSAFDENCSSCNLFEIIDKKAMSYCIIRECFQQCCNMEQGNRSNYVDPWHLTVYESLFCALFVYISECDEVKNKSFAVMLDMLKKFKSDCYTYETALVDCGGKYISDTMNVLNNFYSKHTSSFGYTNFQLWSLESIDAKCCSIETLIETLSDFEKSQFCMNTIDINGILRNKKNLLIEIPEHSESWKMFTLMLLSLINSYRCNDRYVNEYDDLCHIQVYLPNVDVYISNISVFVKTNYDFNMGLSCYQDDAIVDFEQSDIYQLFESNSRVVHQV